MLTSDTTEWAGCVEVRTGDGLEFARVPSRVRAQRTYESSTDFAGRGDGARGEPLSEILLSADKFVLCLCASLSSSTTLPWFFQRNVLSSSCAESCTVHDTRASNPWWDIFRFHPCTPAKR